MAMLSIDSSAAGFSNVHRADFAVDLLFTPRTLSPDAMTLGWQTANGSYSAVLEAPLQPPIFGTIVRFEVVGASVSGLSIPLNMLWYDLLNGDLRAVNNLFWRNSDHLAGGNGNDTLDGFGDHDLVDGGSGHDLLLGNLGDDTLTGGNGNDSLDGGRDADRLFGDAGDDVLVGGSGSDTLNGGVGSDVLFGGFGNDVLIGRAGADRMLGGAGADTFVFTSVTNSPGAETPDAIVGFSQAEFDRIDLTGIDADTTLDGDQAFVAIGADAFAENAPGTLRWYTGPSGFLLVVELNTDNDAAAEMTLLVNAIGNMLAGSDFLL